MHTFTNMDQRGLRWMSWILGALAILSSAGCASRDLGGVTPTEYYRENPRANQVVIETRSHMIAFAPGSSEIDAVSQQAFMDFIGDTSPESVETIAIESASGDVMSGARREALENMLMNAGFRTIRPQLSRNAELGAGQTVIHITHAKAIGPKCPDWTGSATTSYGNDWHSNMRCASVTNLGRMVADPRDLVRGQGKVRPDTERNSIAVQRYRSGVGGEAPAASGDSGSAEGSGNAGGASSSGGAASGGAASGGGY